MDAPLHAVSRSIQLLAGKLGLTVPAIVKRRTGHHFDRFRNSVDHHPKFRRWRDSAVGTGPDTGAWWTTCRRIPGVGGGNRNACRTDPPSGWAERRRRESVARGIDGVSSVPLTLSPCRCARRSTWAACGSTVHRYRPGRMSHRTTRSSPRAPHASGRVPPPGNP